MPKHKRLAFPVYCILLGMLTACGGTSSSQITPVPGKVWTKTSIGVFGDPHGVAVHPDCTGSCNVFVSDPGNKTVYLVKPDGSRAPIADFSLAGSTFDPQGVAVSHSGVIYVADKAPGGSSYVYSIQGFAGAVNRIGGSLVPFPLYNRGVAAYYRYKNTRDQGWATYSAQATHHPLTSKGRVTCVRGTACLFGSHTFNDPYDVAVDKHNSPFVADARDKKAYRVTAHNAVDLGKTFVDPYGIAVTADGQYVYVADAGAKKVYQRSPDGTWTEIGTFGDPYAVTVTADRTVYVADRGDKNVYKLTP